ncbi:hypothetical protein NCCP2495_30670 [Dietzia sp. NCCP-2495]|uniref:hypothetical protein n=1 Tax=Dietzia sp. NCCP-2495 TaxID=2934675 RepID=UPI00222FFBC0|nr:hypothetical protein [Dietzia sp. NCCP-2495]GLB65187.1 hypothetical protein NCCP2495_30670 [Dietzia sp. NCCP-2495]
MTGPSEDFGHREGRETLGQSEDRGVPYEYPSLDEQPGYWARWWVEFKKRLRQSWDNDPVSRVTLILSAIVFFGMTIWGLINKYLVPLVFP